MGKLIIKQSEIDTRGEKKVRVSFRIPPSWNEKIEQLCNETKREFSDVARIVFGFGLERAEAESVE